MILYSILHNLYMLNLDVDELCLLLTCITRYLPGSLAIFATSWANSLKDGRLSASTNQPGKHKRRQMDAQLSWQNRTFTKAWRYVKIH